MQILYNIGNLNQKITAISTQNVFVNIRQYICENMLKNTNFIFLFAKVKTLWYNISIKEI